MSSTSFKRQYRFDDHLWKIDRSTGSKVDTEIQNIGDFINNLINGIIQFNDFILVAPDGKLFKLSVVYQSDGVTPFLQLQQVTFP